MSSYLCEKCNSIVKENEKFGSGRFCSRKCSNSRPQTEETRKKKSLSAKAFHENNPEVSVESGYKAAETVRNTKGKREEINKKISNSVILSHKNPEIIKKISESAKGRTVSQETRLKMSNLMKSAIKNGTRKGWASRNKESYAESFWRKVLEQNEIPFKQELRVLHSELNMNSKSCYFLDFFLTDKNVDLEIDGKQHLLPDRVKSDKIRNSALIENGYTVYRIPWIDPKFKSEEVKQQINEFLYWYNNQ